MKKFYNEIEFEIVKFLVTEDLLNISDEVVFEEESDGNTTTVPSDW